MNIFTNAWCMWVCDDTFSSTQQGRITTGQLRLYSLLPKAIYHPNSISGQLPSRSPKDGCSSDWLQILAQLCRCPTGTTWDLLTGIIQKIMSGTFDGIYGSYSIKSSRLWLYLRGVPFDFGSYSTISQSACRLEEDEVNTDRTGFNIYFFLL